MSQLSDRAIEIAKGQAAKGADGNPIGIEKPKGSNWGRPVQDYLASVDIYFPASWCMAFVYYCVDQAAKQLGLVNPLLKTGGVLNGYNYALKNHITSSTPMPGSIFIMDLGHGLGHTGFVTEIDHNTGVLKTIEGNTNDTGSREGYEVAERTRAFIPGGSIKGFIII